jgi:DNA repair exonuclease SbcCD ATPase subunit
LEACSLRLQEADAALASLKEVSTGTGNEGEWAEVLVLGEVVGLQEGHCPLCGSEVGEDEFLSHIREARMLVQQRDEAISRLTSERLSLRGRHQELEEEVEESQALLDEHERAGSGIRARIEAVTSQARELGFNRESVTADALRSLGEKQREEARRVERWAMLLETSVEMDDLATLQDRLDVARKAQSKLEGSVSDADRAEDKAKEAYDAVRRIEREVIDERLAALGPFLEEFYLRLKPHLDWASVRYRLRGDVQHYLSLEVGEGLNPRFMFSSGQRRAMGIAFLLAAYLSSSWTRLRTLILDDPVQHVDDFRALHLAEVLNGIRKQGRQIICSAEDPELARLIARRLRGIRSEAGALVELEYQLGTGVSVERYELMNPVSQRVLESA